MRTGRTRCGKSASDRRMRSTISRNAAKYSGRALRSGRTRSPRFDERQKAARTHGTALEPAAEYRQLSRTRVQLFGQSEQRRPIDARRAREHDGEARHEKARPGTPPGGRIPGSHRAQIDEPLLVFPVDHQREMTIRRGLIRHRLEHTEAYTHRVRQPAQRLEITVVALAQARECLLADTRATSPGTVRQCARPRLPPEQVQRPCERSR